jgi:histidinol phosphatase-like PHP family hydrolase
MPAKPIYLQCDFHVHTRYSPCAEPEMLPGHIIQAARERGIERLGFSDHVFGFTDTSILAQVRRECPPASGVEIFFGCEADVLSVGKTTVTQEMKDTLDYITVSASHFMNVYINRVERPTSNDPEVVGRHYVEMFAYAATLDYADVIAHPFYMMPGTYDVESIYTIKENDLLPGIESAAANGVAMEMSRRAMDPAHTPFMRKFYSLCKEAGIKFAVGSDSHNLGTVGRLDAISPLVEELQLEDKDFWLPGRNGGAKS